MATNDWTIFIDGSSNERFQWKKNKTLFIVQKQVDNKWSAFLYDDDAGHISDVKEFVFKIQALAYAKDYMKKH